MKILHVVAHARRTSLTHQAAEAFAEAARAKGHTIEWADLVAEGFDPVLREADEADWDKTRINPTHRPSRRRWPGSNATRPR